MIETLLSHDQHAQNGDTTPPVNPIVMPFRWKWRVRWQNVSTVCGDIYLFPSLLFHPWTQSVMATIPEMNRKSFYCWITLAWWKWEFAIVLSKSNWPDRKA